MTYQEISHHQSCFTKAYTKQVKVSPQEIVKHLGAMQAQDYSMAKWAIGSRCDATEAAIEEAINSAEIIQNSYFAANLAFCFC
jgi:hypothetical protein